MPESYYIDELVNAGLEMEIEGRRLRFAELRVKDFARLQEHLRRIQPKPSDLVANALKHASVTDEEKSRAMLAAYEADLYWPATVDSKTGLHLIEKDAGARSALIRYTLEKHHPTITESEAQEIADSMTFRQWAVIANFVVAGRRPGSPEPEGGEAEGEPTPMPAATGIG
jgi:hypothetical protein